MGPEITGPQAGVGTWFQPLQDLRTQMAQSQGPASTRSWGQSGWVVTGVDQLILEPQPQDPSYHLRQIKLILTKKQEGTTHIPRHVGWAQVPLSGHQAWLYITSRTG